MIKSLYLLILLFSAGLPDASSVMEEIDEGDPLVSVLSLLPLVNDAAVMEDIAKELNVVVPDEKKGDRKFVFRAVMNFMNSEAFDTIEDSGAGNADTLLEILKEHLKIKKPKSEINDDDDSDREKKGTQKEEEESSSSASVEPLKLHKLKEFKISGQIGSPGQKDKLSYSSLSYQITNGKERGFSQKEICAAVIRATTPGVSLRTYLEGKKDLKLKTLIPVLRAHFKEKDATAVFNELSQEGQTGCENELEFCMRMMGLRQKVLMLTAEEEGKYPEKLVQQQFQNSMFEGLKKDNIRNALRNILKRKDVKDEELLQEISEVMMNEAEHLRKVKSKASVQQLHLSEADSDKKKESKTNPLLTEISKLTALMVAQGAQVNELTGLKSEMANLKTEMKACQDANRNQNCDPGGGQQNFNRNDGCEPGGRGRGRRGRGRGGSGQFGARRVWLCSTCKEAGSASCNHCFSCGGIDHQQRDCPQLQRECPKNYWRLYPRP